MTGLEAREGAPSVRLFALGGHEPPPTLARDLRGLVELPSAAIRSIWQVLEPSLEASISPDTDKLLDIFASAHRVPAAALAAFLGAARLLLRSAVHLDLPARALEEDLDRLLPSEPLVRETLLAGYDAAKAALRLSIANAAIADHGRLLVGVRWRVDAVLRSERGEKLALPVTVLTLHYRDGAEQGRFTIQALPDLVRELRDACDSIVEGGKA